MVPEEPPADPVGPVPVGRQLHDVVVPQLFVLTTGLTALQRRGGLADHAELIDDLLETAAATLADLRRISRGVTDGEQWRLDEVGDRIGHQTRLLGPLTGTTLDVVTVGELVLPGPLADDVSAVVWETAVNAIRHGDADVITVSLHAGDDELAVSVADDGVWQSPVDAASSGLHGLAARARRWGGRLEIAEGAAGTRVTWRVPLPVANATGVSG